MPDIRDLARSDAVHDLGFPKPGVEFGANRAGDHGVISMSAKTGGRDLERVKTQLRESNL